TLLDMLYKRLILDDEENFISKKMQKYIVFFDEIVPAQLNVDRYFVDEDYKEKTEKLILDDEENFISEKMQKYIAFFDEIVPAQLNVNRYFVDEDYKEKT
ncbi:2417_t:CDS:2, partial [Rhizophagus irregularis]